MDETSTRPAADLAALRDSVKWLVGASGATVAVVVAGLQLTSLVTLPPVAAVIAAVAAVVAVSCALWLLRGAMQILITPRVDATRLSNREMNDPAMYTGDVLVCGVSADPELRWIQASRGRLLGTSPTVTELLSQRLKSIQAGPAGRAGVIDIDRRLGALEEEMHLRATEARLDVLMSKLPMGAAIFALALLVFSITPAFAKPVPPDLAADETIQVRVFVVDSAVSSVDASCGAVRSGAIVDGSFVDPVVVLVPLGSCPAQQVTEPKGVVIVPR